MFAHVNLFRRLLLLAATKATRRRRCSRERLQLAHLLPRVKRPLAARQRTTQRRTATTTDQSPSAPPRSNCWQSLARALAPRRYSKRTQSIFTTCLETQETHLQSSNDNERQIKQDLNFAWDDPWALSLVVSWEIRQPIKWDPLMIQGYVISFKDRREMSSQCRIRWCHLLVISVSKAFCIPIWVCHPNCIFCSPLSPPEEKCLFSVCVGWKNKTSAYRPPGCGVLNGVCASGDFAIISEGFPLHPLVLYL